MAYPATVGSYNVYAYNAGSYYFITSQAATERVPIATQAGPLPRPKPPATLAAPSYVGNVGSGSVKSTTATTMVITPSATVAAGDAIIITIGTDPLQTLEIWVTDSQNNAYYPVACSVSSGNVRTHIFAAYDVTALHPMPSPSLTPPSPPTRGHSTR